MIGQRLLHYEIVEKLGEGGMGVVYKARDTRLDRFVALKFLPPEKIADPGRKARFVQEAKSASALNHPNIITIYDIDSVEVGQAFWPATPDRPNGLSHHVHFIAMEYVAGKTLGELIGRKGLKLSDALKYGAQIADALAAAHGAGLIHRDLKPGNVMVTGAGLVKVLDFGLAKLTEIATGEFAETRTQRPKTEEGTILGTAAYMSPEQAEGKKLDARSDIFSFGAVLHEMITGQRAFRGDSKMSTLSAVLHKEPEPLPAEVPRELARIVTRCLRKDPERRFQHIDDIKIALQELKEESDSGKLTPEQAASAGTPRRTFLLAAAASVLVLAVASLAAWLWYSRARPAATPALLEAVPLTTYPGSETYPSFSPDGTQVAFTWCKDGNCDIYVKQIGIEEPYRLTNNSQPDLAPEWSPDGAYIAFTRFQRDRGRVQYILIPQRGGPERVLSDFAAPRRLTEDMPFGKKSWCPDSRSLVVVSPQRESGVGLDLISMAGEENRRLTDPGIYRTVDAYPAVSPDGQWLAFTRNTSESQRDLYVLRLSAGCAPQGAPIKLEAGGQKWSSGWTPDSRELLYSSGSLGGRTLFRITPVPPWTPVQVPIAGFEGLGFAVSRQGRLAFSRSIPDTHLWRITAAQPGGPWSAPERFSSSTQYEMEPQYSPDGDRIAFASERSGELQIWVSDRNGASLMQLTFLERFIAHRPRWSPDGRWIAFWGIAAGNRDVYVVGAAGGAPRRLTNHPTLDTNPEWSCDGKYVEFQSDRDPAMNRWRVPAAGGEAEKRKTESSNWAADSPDCQAIFYRGAAPDQSKLWRKPVAGGDAVVVAGSLHPTAGWQIFSDGIYYVGKPAEGGPSPILYHDFATGKTRQLATIPRPFWGFTVSPDRRSIVYANSGQAESDLMLVENFR